MTWDLSVPLMIINFSLKYEDFVFFHMSNSYSVLPRRILLMFLYQDWKLSGHVYVSYGPNGNRIYLYITSFSVRRV
jgi:hypothetical protein